MILQRYWKSQYKTSGKQLAACGKPDKEE